jgi:hypothetical protein
MARRLAYGHIRLTSVARSEASYRRGSKVRKVASARCHLHTVTIVLALKRNVRPDLGIRQVHCSRQNCTVVDNQRCSGEERIALLRNCTFHTVGPLNDLEFLYFSDLPRLVFPTAYGKLTHCTAPTTAVAPSSITLLMLPVVVPLT